MKLYTLQPEFRVKELQETGILKSGDKIMDDYFLDSYAWLEGKMRELLPASEMECLHPVWAWYKYRGKRKPDMRYAGYCNRGEDLYRIEFDIEDERVLLTAFDDWHFVLNSLEEDKLLQRCSLPLDWHSPEEIVEGAEQGWVVQGDKLVYDWNNIIVDVNSAKKDIQATMWYIRMEWVKSIEKFKSR